MRGSGLVGSHFALSIAPELAGQQQMGRRSCRPIPELAPRKTDPSLRMTAAQEHAQRRREFAAWDYSAILAHPTDNASRAHGGGHGGDHEVEYRRCFAR